MKEIITTMTQRGQVTVPSEVRRLLGLKPRDKVAFSIEEDEVRLAPARFTLESAFGSVKPATRTADLKAISRAARDEKLKRERSKLP
jgi:AbrB family looped-hinge helix DNA binding protein